MRTLKLTIAYDGTDFVGWQSQSRGRSVQQTLEAAWFRVTQEKLRMTASGRTDAGVHAAAQVCSLETRTQLDVATLHRALEATTPGDLQVIAVQPARPGFHAIRDAIGKRYQYRIQYGRSRDVFSRRYAWCIGRELDVQRMCEASRALIGHHDFASFQAAGAPRTSTMRHVRHLLLGRGQVRHGEAAAFDLLTVDIEADGFLYNMVRNIVGTLVRVGLGRETVDWPAWVLQQKDRRVAGPTAPPQGLCLVAVHYPPDTAHDVNELG